MTLTDLLILGLFVQRTVAIWLIERICEGPREWLIRRGGWIKYLATCPICLGVWFSIIGLALWMFAGDIGRCVVLVFAVASAAVLLDNVMGVCSSLTRFIVKAQSGG